MSYQEKIDAVLNKYSSDLDLSKSDENSTRLTRCGRENLLRILTKDLNRGASFVEISGSQGSAKTASMISMLKHFMTIYPDDKCFWSSSYEAPLQFLKLGDGTFHIMVLEGSGVKFFNMEGSRKEITFPNESCPYPITYFNSYKSLWERAMPGMCNAVFFGNRRLWLGMFKYLRTNLDWAHIFMDEFGEVASSETKGEDWRLMRQASEDLKENRKCYKNIIFNSQAVSDVDYRIRRKVMSRIFLSGAKADQKTRVWQEAIDNLKKDPIKGSCAYIECDGKFGIIRIKDIFTPLPNRNWMAKIVIEGEEDYGTKTIQARETDPRGYTEGTE